MLGRLVFAILLVGCRDDAVSPVDGAPVPELPTTCEGGCRDTALTAMFFSTRVLDRAVYGNNASNSTLHVEAYTGGDDSCPTEISPTPDYSLVLGKVATPNGTTATTSPGNVVDFVGDLLGGDLGAQATIVIVRAVAAKPDDFVALDVDLEFDAGSLNGHLFATHCASLDSR